MNGQQSKPQGQKFTQKLVNQGPVFDRKLKIHRPNKRKKSSKWI